MSTDIPSIVRQFEKLPDPRCPINCRHVVAPPIAGRYLGVLRVLADRTEYSDVRFYISSPRRGVRQFARAVRRHWGIENTLHWCLDMTFREDESRTRGRQAANNLACLRHLAVSLLKQHPGKQSLAMKRRLAGCPPAFLEEILASNRS